MSKEENVPSEQIRLQGEWVKIESPVAEINVQNAASRGVDLNAESGIYAFNNAARTDSTGASKTMGIMDQICAMAASTFGAHFIASYQGPLGVTIVTDGDTLDRIAEQASEEDLPFPLLRGPGGNTTG